MFLAVSDAEHRVLTGLRMTWFVEAFSRQLNGGAAVPYVFSHNTRRSSCQNKQICLHIGPYICKFLKIYIFRIWWREGGLGFLYNKYSRKKVTECNITAVLRLQFFTPSPVYPIWHVHCGTPCITSQVASVWHFCSSPFTNRGFPLFGSLRHVSIPEQSGWL